MKINNFNRRLVKRFFTNRQGSAALEFLFASIVLIAILFFVTDFMRLRTTIAKLNQASYTAARILANRTTYFSRGTLSHGIVYYNIRRLDKDGNTDSLPPPNIDPASTRFYISRAAGLWDYTSLSRFNMSEGLGGFGTFTTGLCGQWWDQGARYDCLMQGYDGLTKNSFTISNAGTINATKYSSADDLKNKGIRILEEFRKIISVILTNTDTANPRIYLEESLGYPCTVRNQVIKNDDLYPPKMVTTRYDEDPSQYQPSDPEYCGGGIFMDEHGKEGYISRARVTEGVDFFNDLGPKLAPYAQWNPNDMLSQNAAANYWKTITDSGHGPTTEDITTEINTDITFIPHKPPRKIPLYRVTVCIPKPKGIFIFFFSSQKNAYMFNDNLCSSSITVAR